MIRRKRPRPERVEREPIKRSQRVREQVEERDHGICAACGTYDAKWIHEHIRPLSMGGSDTLENSETRCRRHATEKTSKETTERAKADRLAARHEQTKRRKPVGARA